MHFEISRSRRKCNRYDSESAQSLMRDQPGKRPRQHRTMNSAIVPPIPTRSIEKRAARPTPGLDRADERHLVVS